MSNIKRLTIQQGSQEWLNLRCQYVTSTLSHKIKDNFSESAIKQFKGKAGKINEEYSKMGHLGETLVLKHLRDVMGHDIIQEQPTYVSEELGMLSSVDGENSDGTVLYEIKTCVSKDSKTYEKISKGVVPTQHMYQIQHSMALVGYRRCFYCVCLLTDGTTGDLDTSSLRFKWIEPDLVLQAKIKERAAELIKADKEGTLEIPATALPPEHKDIAESYMQVKGTIGHLEGVAKGLWKKLVAIGPHKANGVTVTKVNGKQNVDYRAALNKVWPNLRQEEQLMIKNSVEEHTTFSEDHYRVTTKKTVMYVDNSIL